MTSAPSCMSLVNRLLGVALLAVFLVATQSCKAKPSEEACRDAINNIRRISGQEGSDMGADPIAVIRSCRGNSSKKSVECMRVAKTLEDLNACEGEVGDKYFKEEIEATEQRIKKSSEDDQPTEAKPDESAPATPTEAKPTEAKPTEAKPTEEAKPDTPKKPDAISAPAVAPGADRPAADKPAADKPAAASAEPAADQKAATP